MTGRHDTEGQTIAYFECFSGASGDMILGSLVDAGWPVERLRATLAAVPIDGWELEVAPTKKGALRATRVTIRVTAPQPERSVLEIVPLIESSSLPGSVKARAIALFRELADVEALQHADEPENVHFHEVGAVDSILDIIGSVAGLEALGVTRVHVSPVNVGGGLVNTRDGILPVPGPATLELLRRRAIPVYSSEYGPEFLTPTGALVLGCLADASGPFPAMTVDRIGYGAGQKDFRVPNVLRVSIGPALPGPDPIGRVRAALASEPLLGAASHGDHGHDHGHDHDDHGHRLPSPVATGEGRGVGAVPRATASESRLALAPPSLAGKGVGGLGPSPGLGGGGIPAGGPYLEDEVVQIETNVDDMSGEWFGYLSETLMSRGALDVTMLPATMKKGRPATVVSVLVRPERVDDAVATVFRETTTLGVRVRPTRRLTLPRTSDVVETAFGPIRVKVAMLGSAVRSVAPEYEDCRAAATRSDVSLQSVMAAAAEGWRRRTPTPTRQP